MKGQFPAVLPLGSLNGQNGFKLDEENNNDVSDYPACCCRLRWRWINAEILFGFLSRRSFS